jgi:hypothetical protein
MRETNNLHVIETVPLLAPDALKHELKISDIAATTVRDRKSVV